MECYRATENTSATSLAGSDRWGAVGRQVHRAGRFLPVPPPVSGMEGPGGNCPGSLNMACQIVSASGMPGERGRPCGAIGTRKAAAWPGLFPKPSSRLMRLDRNQSFCSLPIGGKITHQPRHDRRECDSHSSGWHRPKSDPREPGTSQRLAHWSSR